MVFLEDKYLAKSRVLADVKMSRNGSENLDLEMILRDSQKCKNPILVLSMRNQGFTQGKIYFKPAEVLFLVQHISS